MANLTVSDFKHYDTFRTCGLRNAFQKSCYRYLQHQVVSVVVALQCMHRMSMRK
jgi:hypothetical protein